MEGENSFEIIHKTVNTGYLMLPKPSVSIQVTALVRCPDGSELLITHHMNKESISPEEIDRQILRRAQEEYQRRPGAAPRKPSAW
jgi:hypothetical protein